MPQSKPFNIQMKAPFVILLFTLLVSGCVSDYDSFWKPVHFDPNNVRSANG